MGAARLASACYCGLTLSARSVEYPCMRLFAYHLNPRFELTQDGELLCHCEHCGVRRVPGFHIRGWLAQAHRIVLPGLDGWLVITRCRVPRPRLEAKWFHVQYPIRNYD